MGASRSIGDVSVTSIIDGDENKLLVVQLVRGRDLLQLMLICDV